MNDFARAIQKLDVNSACMPPTVASLVDPVRVLSLKYPTLAGEVGTKDNADTALGRPSLQSTVRGTGQFKLKENRHVLKSCFPGESCWSLSLIIRTL